MTLDGRSLPLPDPFLVLATQNPVEEEGVYRLPEAQLDRFLVRVPFPYPSLADEMRILRTHARAQAPPQAVATVAEIRQAQAALEEIPMGDGVLRTAGELARETRRHPAILLGPVSYTHLRAHETVLDLVCRLLLENKKKPTQSTT